MTNIYVGNLNFQTTEQDLVETFSQFGNVERVNIVRDRETGQTRGFAFVEMTDGAETAIAQLNGAEVQGRTLNVSPARPKPISDNRRGGQDRRYGGNRGGRW